MIRSVRVSFSRAHCKVKGPGCDANQSCKSSDLASVPSLETNSFLVTRVVDRKQMVWIGGRRRTGVADDDDLMWKWSDGSGF